MYEESAISIFRKLPETKEQVNDYFKLIRNSVLAGEVDELDFIKQVTAMENLFKSLKSDEQIKDAVLEAAEKYNQKSFVKGSAQFQIKEVGVKYDYSECNDSLLEELSSQQAELSEKIKAREVFLKSIPVNSEVYGEDGVQLFPPKKSSTTQVVITLK